ncbi:CHAD domain-containing protein [Acetobacterium paludosum]|uniref:CHAD domain-containing protein n=2 Tax=Acetobacterium paludosum TaxID=52693 RepID=A0A923HYZ5_9FIRM|nr:CHAD domain-containing protein [Acetobacterium paludosum]
MIKMQRWEKEKMEDNIEKVLRIKIEDTAVFEQIMAEFLHIESFESTAVNQKIIKDTYYDNANKDLFLAGFEYSIRKEENGSLAILNQRNLKKQINFIQEKKEWRVRIEKSAPNNAFLKEDAIKKVLEKVAGGNELAIIFQSSFTRKKINLLKDNETWIEIDGDQGEIWIDDLKKPIFQLQFKLKNGNIIDLLKLAAVIIKKYSLKIDRKSKYERGLELLGIDLEEGHPKAQLKIKQKDCTSDVAQRILEFCINEISNAYTYFSTHLEDPESTHQIRVKIRKSRAILAFFKPLFEDEKYGEEQEKLRKTGLEFSELRQLDVILEEIEKIENTSIIPVDELAFLKNRLIGKRKEALITLSAYLQHNYLTLTVLDFWIWLLDEPWSDSAWLDLSIEKYIDEELKRWLKKVNKGMKKMDVKNKENIHKVRIRSKKLRYIMELLSPILAKKSKELIAEFENIQDDLGYFHDVYMNKELLEQLLAESAEKQLHYEAGIMIGWLTLQGNIKMEKYR